MTDALLDLGLAPLGAGLPEDADPVAARSYSHPQLGDRQVIRLIGQAVAPAEDAAMAFFGFGAPTAGPALVAGRPQALGYPAWALVHDPANAAVALSVVAGVAGMEKTARLAASRPGFAAEQYADLAGRLPVSHLPAFWEQAGRAYIAAGNGGQAAAAFGRARAAELTHDLTVDEDRRREVYLEFAAGGGLAIRAIAEYVDDLRRRYAPDRAYSEFVRLAERRTASGFAPWAGMPKQARTLAKAAGLDVAAEDARLLRLLLDLPATRHAPAGFWTAWRGALVRLAKGSPQFRRRLLELFPGGPDDDLWIGVLEDAGAIDLLLDEATGRPAAWLTQVARHRNRTWAWDRKPAPKLYSTVSRLAARLAADGVAAELGAGRSWRSWGLDLDLLETCLTHGVPVAPPRGQARLMLDNWLRNQGLDDLPATAADPVFGPLLSDEVAGHLAAHHRPDELVRVPVLRPLVHRALHAWIATARGGGVQAAGEALAHLDKIVDANVLARFGDLREAIATVDVTAALTRSLRAGVYDEYGWPALDEAAHQLGVPALGMSASWPVLTVWSRSRVVAVGPDGLVAEHDLRVPRDGRLAAVVFSGGEFLVAYYRDSHGFHGYWSGRPAESFPLDFQWHTDLSRGLLNPSGDRLSGSQVLRVGDRVLRADRPVITDGHGYWTSRADKPDKPGFFELDPESGRTGTASLPACFAALELPPGEALAPHSSWLVALPGEVVGSPLGQHGGLAGFAVIEEPSTDAYGWNGQPRRIVGVDGRSADLSATHAWSPRPAAAGLIRFPAAPADQPPHLLTGELEPQLESVDGCGHHWTVVPGQPAPGTPLVPPLVFWPFLRPRDPAGSAALRHVRDHTVSDLVAAVDAEQDGRMLAETVGRFLPDVTHLRLRLGVAGLVLQAQALADRKRSLLSIKPAPRKAAEPVAESDLLTALEGLPTPGSPSEASGPLWFYGGPDPDRPLAELAAVSRVMGGGELPTAGIPDGSGGWLTLIRGAGVAAIRAINPFFAPAQRRALLALLELWATTPFVRPEVEVLVGVVTAEEQAVFRDRHGVCVAFGYTYRYGHGHTRRLVGVRYGQTNPKLNVPVVGLEVLPVGWGSAEQLAGLLRLAGEQGPAPWSPPAADALATDTGLSRAAARLLLAGLPGIGRYEHNFLDKDTRRGLGLKVAEAAAGRNELQAFPRHELVGLYGTAMPEDLAELWSQDGQLRYAQRLAEAFGARFGRRRSVASETIAAARTLDLTMPAVQLLGIAAEPAGSAELNHDGHSLDALILDLAQLLPWAYSCLPAGDPVRHGVPQTLELIRRRLDNPQLLVSGGTLVPHEDIRDQVARLLGDPAGDNTVQVTYDRWAPEVRFRPARLPQGLPLEESPLGKLLAASGYERTGLPNAILLLRGEGYAAMAERVSSGALPAGRYESDPAACVPDVLADVRARLRLEADPARLYLQLLTLLEPTDRNVRQWNGWTPAQHRKAIATLVEHGLVVEDKRARAWRSAFLPGPWLPAKAPNLPLERSKLELHRLCLHDDGGVHGWLPRWLPTRPLTELFTEAWQHAASTGEAR